MVVKRLKAVSMSEVVKRFCAKNSSEQGQSTVEYAIVFAVLLSVVVALGALMSVVADGVFVEHAKTSASHDVEDSAGGMSDVFVY